MERVERYIFCRWREREKAFECFPLDVSGDYILFISLCPSGSSLVPYINYTGRNAVDNYL